MLDESQQRHDLVELGRTIHEYLDSLKDRKSLVLHDVKPAYKARVTKAWVYHDGRIGGTEERMYPDGGVLSSTHFMEARCPRSGRRIKQGPHAPRRHLKQAARSLIGDWRQEYDISFTPAQPIKYFHVTIKKEEKANDSTS